MVVPRYAYYLVHVFFCAICYVSVSYGYIWDNVMRYISNFHLLQTKCVKQSDPYMYKTHTRGY